MNVPALVAALHAGARDDAEAVAVEALTEPPSKPYWLGHAAFIARFVDTSGATTRVRWADAVAAIDQGELPAPTYQQNLLRLAASQAAGVPVSLRDCTVARVIAPITLTDAARHDASRATS